MNEDLRKLRKKFDGDDGFMARGHGIKKVRTRIKDTPVWATNNTLTKALLLSVFPKLRSNTKQRRAAARWARVIHLYYRVGMPRNHVAAEIGITRETFKSLIRNIRRAARGRELHGNRLRGQRPKGRPKSAPPPPLPLLG